jgi:FdhE protein
MNPHQQPTSETVRQAAAGIIAARPSYRELITFYGRIFAAQEDAAGRVRLDPIPLSDDMVRLKRSEGMPLVMTSEMAFDPSVTETLLGEICRIAADGGAELSDAARRLSAGSVQAARLFAPFLKEQEAIVAAAADEMGVAPRALAFFLYHSLKPSLCRCSGQLSGFLEQGQPWEHGYCPICGSPAGLGCLDGDGSRFLICGFCWHRWPLQRLACPFCGSRDQQKLHYFYSEEEKHYRVDACDTCRKYVKTVDTRNLSRLCYPPLEQIASLHLDLKAAEAGYASGLPVAPAVHSPDGASVPSS